MEAIQNLVVVMAAIGFVFVGANALVTGIKAARAEWGRENRVPENQGEGGRTRFLMRVLNAGYAFLRAVARLEATRSGVGPGAQEEAISGGEEGGREGGGGGGEEEEEGQTSPSVPLREGTGASTGTQHQRRVHTSTQCW
ncbi:hypothetical protein DTO212C5_8141 [Paecilomyces variotii]|nr:hypothetical protein DTO212C5_8141 [Paecilomyces variotii]